MLRYSAVNTSLREIIREQSGATAREALAERLAVQAASGDHVVSRPWDPKAARRAARSFALLGGELCGCAMPGCRTCASDGTFGDETCRCASYGCPMCTPPWSAPPRRVGKLLGRREQPPPTAPLPSGFEIEPGFPEGFFAPRYFCIHSHLSVFTRESYEDTLDSSHSGDTDIDERIAMLESLRPDYGVERLVVSAMLGGRRGADPTLDGPELDVMAAYAYSVNPDYFVPFVRGFDINSPNLFWIELCLAWGFRGIGELFCFGYGNELENIGTLVEVCELAARYHVPLAVHWEIGNRTADDARTPAEAAWNQLFSLLNQFPTSQLDTFTRVSEDEPLPFKLILCHCGSGPDITDPYMIREYEARLDLLLKGFPNVYFDLAGMQGPEGPVLYARLEGSDTLTLLGRVIADRVLAYPDRFLFGVDATERSAEDFEAWASSIPNYDAFLTLAGITDSATRKKFRYDNAVHVLYSGPPPMFPSTSGAWSTGSWTP